MQARTLAGLAAALVLPQAGALELEELVVTGRHDARTIDVNQTLSVSPDVAQLLMEAPGANITRNGPISGIPQYRGLFGPRIAVSLDGNLLAPAGPNWMDPPISYAVTAQLEALEVYRGIAPVSLAPETLGGVIDARVRRIAFGDSDGFRVEGQMAGSAQSVNDGYQLDTDIQAANRQHRFKLSAMIQDGDNAEFPGGEILPSSYERQRYDIGYGYRSNDHSIQFDYGYNDTGNAGTPALGMDIDYFEGDIYSVSYRYEPSSGPQVLARVFGSDLDHGMTNYHLRPAPQAAALWRQNIALASSYGFKLELSQSDDSGLWRVGADGFHEDHDSDIDNPNNPMFFVVNFNNASREIFGAYVEREQNFLGALSGEFGARVNRVSSDADAVNGTPAMMMPPAGQLRDSFNAADRSRAETNVDVFAKLNYALTDAVGLYGGIAQKQRGPGYQERYLWLPLEATAGLADGQVYVGNIELNSERAHTLELGADVSLANFSAHPRVFYTRIDDYIQGTPLGADQAATRMTRMMNNANGTQRPDPLQFNNVEAQLYGFDMDWAWRVSDQLELSGLFNYVRGERRDVDDDLYRIAPANMTLRAMYSAGPWSGTLETIAYAAQDDVSVTNREQTSAGYATVNLRGTWQASADLQFALGIDNLFDREYQPHLGGYNRVSNPDVAVGTRLRAQGINVFGRVLYSF